MKISIMIEKYLDYSKKVKASGANDYDCTICKYLASLNNYDDAQINSEILNDFIIELKAQTSLANVTINKCIRMLRQIYRFLSISNGDLERYRYLKERHKRFDMILKNELMHIFKYVNALNKSKNSLQYRLMMYILWDTGIRQNELLNIKVSNINTDESYIYLEVVKTQYERIVIVSKQVMNMIINYLQTREKSHEYLFYNILRNRQFNRKDLKAFYQRMKKQTGIKKIHSHMFRHTCATDLIEHNVPLDIVQKQLGHQSIKTTFIYLHHSLKRQKEELSKILR